MIKSEELKQIIRDNGLRMDYIAQQIGITRSAFYNKLNGESEFTQSEIVKICKTVGINKEQMNDIFFCV